MISESRMNKMQAKGLRINLQFSNFHMVDIKGKASNEAVPASSDCKVSNEAMLARSG